MRAAHRAAGASNSVGEKRERYRISFIASLVRPLWYSASVRLAAAKLNAGASCVARW